MLTRYFAVSSSDFHIHAIYASPTNLWVYLEELCWPLRLDMDIHTHIRTCHIYVCVTKSMHYIIRGWALQRQFGIDISTKCFSVVVETALENSKSTAIYAQATQSNKRDKSRSCESSTHQSEWNLFMRFQLSSAPAKRIWIFYVLHWIALFKRSTQRSFAYIFLRRFHSSRMKSHSSTSIKS